MSRPTSKTPFRFRTGCRRLLAVAFGLMLSLIIIEIAGRIVHFLPSPPADAYVKLSNAVGPLPDPLSRTFNRSPQGEFGVWLDFNALGFRDPRSDFGDADGKQRWLFLGDSYTAAWQVPLEQRWTEQLAHFHPDWETLNLGMPNWGTDQEYLTLVNYPLNKAPDATVLMFFAGNDVSDNAHLLLMGAAPNHPYFVPKEQTVHGFPSLQAIGWHYSNPFDQPGLLPFPSNIRAWLNLNSVVYRALSKLWRALHPEKESPPAPIPDSTRLPTELNVFQKEDSADWETSWGITEALLSEMKSAAAARGSRFMIVLTPYYATIQANQMPLYLKANTTALDISKPYRHLTTFAQANAIPLLDLTPGFSQFYQADPQHRDLFFKTDEHFTALGNCLAAVLIAKWLDPAATADVSRCQ